MAGIKNYSTRVPVEKTILEIEMTLAHHGASDIWKQYGGEGGIVGLNFVLPTDYGRLPFRLPMRPHKLRQALKKRKENGELTSLPWKRIDDPEAIARIGWRVINDWIEAQLSLVEIELTTLEEVMLPYAYDIGREKTLYEVLEERQFKGMLMEGQEG